MTDSILKVPIVAYIARQYCFIFLLKNKRYVQRENLKLELKSTLVINVVVLPRDIKYWCKFV